MIPYEVGYMYLRDEDNHPRVTIAYMHVEEDELGTTRLWYGVACQNVEHDRWDRAVGRNKANGRLNSIAEAKKCPKLYNAFDRAAMTRQEAQSTIVEHVLEEGSRMFPRRVIECAKNYFAKEDDYDDRPTLDEDLKEALTGGVYLERTSKKRKIF